MTGGSRGRSHENKRVFSTFNHNTRRGSPKGTLFAVVSALQQRRSKVGPYRHCPGDLTGDGSVVDVVPPHWTRRTRCAVRPGVGVGVRPLLDVDGFGIDVWVRRDV